MVHGEFGSTDTRFERLTDHYREAITRGDLTPGERFPSARELVDMHGVGRTTAGRVHGTLISLGLIEHRPGIGTFVTGPPAASPDASPDLGAAARNVVHTYDQWHSRAKPASLSAAVDELRNALRDTRDPAGEKGAIPDR